jgi:hypothetical protein
MKFLTAKCKLCPNKRKLFGAYKVKIRAADGEKTISVCDDCAVTLEGLNQLKQGKELREDVTNERSV